MYGRYGKKTRGRDVFRILSRIYDTRGGLYLRGLYSEFYGIFEKKFRD